MKYDCIVLGVGGVGSAALLAAAKRGWSTVGIERFGSAHDQGSSHGRTRIIRTAYFEHPNYVPLVRRAWQHWESLQSETKTPLIRRTGLLQAGSPNGPIIGGVLASAREHDIPIRQMTSAETMQRFPAIKLPSDAVGVFEQSAGLLLVENCVAQMIKLALQRGATLQTNTIVEGIAVNPNGLVKVTTSSGDFETARLIVTAGAWSAEWLSSLPIEISVVRKQQQWFQIDRTDIKFENGFPVFLVETDDGCFYGFPELDYLGMKVAEHSGGNPVTDPGNVEREINRQELARTEKFLDNCFHFTRRRLVHYNVCMYSNSRDGHFIVDRYPGSPNIVFAAGLSGHGFKFAPLLGERLVGMLEQESDPMFEFLKIGGRQLMAAS